MPRSIEGHKFIALRKQSTAESDGILTASTEDKRLKRLKEAPLSNRVQNLEKIGLKQFDQTERIVDDESGFQRLGYLGAYVINSPQQTLRDEAANLLSQDYEIMPNIQLGLPTPGLSYNRLSIRKANEFSWPEITGISHAHQRGFTGGGVLVGVLDTGCDADHDELRNKRINFRYIPHDRNLNPMRNVRAFDTDGHGTHVCGIIAGQGVGIAPDVDLLVAAVIESETLKTNLERIALGLDWMLSQITQPDNVDKPSIINMSLGFKQNWLEGDDLKTALSGMRKIIRTLVDDFDVLPVIAVGNDGRGVIRVPASFDEVLAVGALTYNNEPWDRSGGGNSPLTQSIKPDIAGYGVDVLSSIERDVDNKSWYARMTGTSMATPYVSGIAALLASSDNRLQGQRLRERLIENAHSMDFPQDRVGVGLARYS